jgi:hypothetical protein
MLVNPTKNRLILGLFLGEAGEGDCELSTLFSVVVECSSEGITVLVASIVYVPAS